MDKEHVKGIAHQVKGAVKEALGKATNDPALEVEGKIEKTEGKARRALGDAKDAVREGLDKLD